MKKKEIYFLGFITYGILFLLSLYFYKERTIFSDLSFILYEIITSNELSIQVNRFVSVFSQSFALAGRKLNLPLEVICQMYSASFIIYYFISFLILIKWLKHKYLALGLVLFNVLMTRHTFYWTPSELIQGTAFVFFYLALLDNILRSEKLKMHKIPVLLILLLFAIFAHPLLSIAIVFGLLYMTLHVKKRFIFSIVNFLVIVSIYFAKSKIFPNEYDTEAISSISNLYDWQSYFQRIKVQGFFDMLLSDYLIASLIATLVSFYLVFKKKYLKLLLLFTFVIGYCILVNIAQLYIREQYYIESQYLILSFFIILPLVLDIIPTLKKSQLTLLACISIVVFSSFKIFENRKPYVERLNWHRDFLKKSEAFDNKKLVLHRAQVPLDTLIATWGSSYEFWLLSTIENKETRSVIISDKVWYLNWVLDEENKKQFFTRWDFPEYHSLDEKYFILKDTSHIYIKYDDSIAQ